MTVDDELLDALAARVPTEGELAALALTEEELAAWADSVRVEPDEVQPGMTFADDD